MSQQRFSSEGFDLDAVPTDEEGVIYEIGGGATKEEIEKEEVVSEEKNNEAEDSPIATSNLLKQEGNKHFQQGEWLDAFDSYSGAIEACPGLSGAELLQQRDEFEAAERERVYQIHRQRQEEDRRRSSSTEGETPPDPPKPNAFQPPPHEYGKELSVYYCNRAACLLHLSRYDEAINDCDVAIILKLDYAKAYMRRATAYENTERTEEALRDAKAALELEPSNALVRKTVSRLEKLEAERLEKLKTETIGKLKDLGNSILGNFGLSLDNFNAVQDPSTGSYSISFDQNGSSTGKD